MKHVDADVEFECIENKIDWIAVKIVVTGDHESVIERSERTAKELIRRMV